MWFPDKSRYFIFRQACFIAGLREEITPYPPVYGIQLPNGCVIHERIGTLIDDTSILPKGFAIKLFIKNNDFKKVIQWLNLNVFELQLDCNNERFNSQTLAVRLRIGSNMLFKLKTVPKTELIEIDNYIKNVFYLRQAVAFDIYCKEYLPF